MAADDFEFACRTSDIPEGEGVPVDIRGHRVAVFRSNDKFYALDDKCAHGKGKLSDGDIEDLDMCVNGTRLDGRKKGGLCVRCPKHQRKFAGGLYFNLKEGRSFTTGATSHYSEGFQVNAYETMVRDGEVHVSVRPKPQVGKMGKLGLLRHKAAANIKAWFNKGGEAEVHEEGWLKWHLRSRKQISPDSYLFRFEAPADVSFPDDIGPAWHVSFRAVIKGVFVSRDYTPISTVTEYNNGFLIFVIKVYPTGKLTPYLENLAIDSSLLISTPHETMHIPSFTTGHDIPADVPPPEHVGLIAGGTGIAPMYQLLKASHDGHPALKGMHFSLLFSTRVRADAYMEEELGALTGRAAITLTGGERGQPRGKEKSGLTWLRGRIDEEMLKGYLMPKKGGSSSGSSSDSSGRPPRKDSSGSSSCPCEARAAPKVVVSGPPGMFETMSSLLRSVGYAKEDLVELEA